MIPATEEVAQPLSDEQLVKACRKGDEAAWADLVDRYKNLVFSIPLKLGMDRDDAADIFQAVWLELLKGLNDLRDPNALPKWLMQTTAHKCFHVKRATRESQEITEIDEPSAAPMAESLLQELEEEQALRDAISALSPRCRQLVQMLFFITPARSYGEIAGELGLAVGSIGFIRGRCLDRLKKELGRRGFQ